MAVHSETRELTKDFVIPLMTPTELAESISRGVENATIVDQPFRLIVFKPFTDDYYQNLLEQLPPSEYYDDFRYRDAVRPDGSSTRKLFTFVPEKIDLLPDEQGDFWKALDDSIRSEEVVSVFFDALKSDLLHRFGNGLKNIPAFPTAKLGQDSDGYYISPHPDSTSRIFTAQIYLAEDDSRPEIGTTIYKKIGRNKFTAVKTLPYLPNTGFCFVPTGNTFHGVERLKLDRVRNNLHLSCFRKDQKY